MDVRILSATHIKTSRELVSAGQFREDLFYRVNVIELHVPPLRDRGATTCLLLADRDCSATWLAESQGMPTPATAGQDAALKKRWPLIDFPGNVQRTGKHPGARANACCRAMRRLMADDIQIQVTRGRKKPRRPVTSGPARQCARRSAGIRRARRHRAALSRSVAITRLRQPNSLGLTLSRFALSDAENSDID